MNLLLIHQNFPGQFRHISQYLSGQNGVNILGIGRDKAPGLPGIRMLRYKPHREVSTATHPYARIYEDAALHGQQVLRLLLDLKKKGYQPDTILAHPGWGESLFVREAFPDVRLIHFCEYYYHLHGADVNFDPEFPLSLDDAARIKMRNGLHLLNLELCDIAVTPTRWQHSLHPEVYWDRIRVVHEGINTGLLGPDTEAELVLPSGKVLKAGQPVVTYVSRNLEPYRGFHIFMRSLPEILRRHPSCEVVVVGGNEVSYGKRPEGFPDWKSRMLQECRVDPKRVHFLGKIPYDLYRKVLQVSAAHVYLTYPFVLSWSMLEAMASGCLVVASDTPPVREMIRSGENGLLVDFFNPAQLAEQVLEVLEKPAAFSVLREAARHTVSACSIDRGNAAYRDMIMERP